MVRKREKKMELNVQQPASSHPSPGQVPPLFFFQLMLSLFKVNIETSSVTSPARSFPRLPHHQWLKLIIRPVVPPLRAIELSRMHCRHIFVVMYLFDAAPEFCSLLSELRPPLLSSFLLSLSLHPFSWQMVAMNLPWHLQGPLDS